MATNFPSSLDNSTSLPYPTATSDTNSPSLSGGQDNQNDAIIAVENKVGINSSTPTSNTVLTGVGSGQSQWGLLTSANVTLATGSGAFVFGTSPTITGATINTPTINNPTLNTDSVVGYTTSNTGTVYGVGITAGVFSSSNIIPTASIENNAVTFAKLASTIFSGQVQTQSNAGSAGGTIYWVNLGGIKIMWAVGASQTTTAAGNTWAFTLPSFFSTIQFPIGGPSYLGVESQQYGSVVGASTSSITVQIVSPNGNAAASPVFFAIGT